MTCPHCAPKGLYATTDPDEAYLNGKRLPLTFRQHAILSLMIRRGGQLSHSAIEMVGVGEHATSAVAKVQIHKLRRRLEPFGVRIEAVRGWGYRLG